MRDRETLALFWCTCISAALWLAGYCLAALVLTTAIAIEVVWCQSHELRWGAPPFDPFDTEAEVYQ